ncbi:MAG: glycosyltransferase family 8 protein [Limisphaerales bacterium]
MVSPTTIGRQSGELIPPETHRTVASHPCDLPRAEAGAAPSRTERIVIAAASDEAYALPLTVMLRSAAEKLSPIQELEAYVVSDGLSSATRSRVEASLPRTARLHWRTRPKDEFEGLPRWGRIALGTYHKMTLGSWLPAEVTKVIWLDCDTLILDDVSALWNEPLRGKTALACTDHLVPRLGAAFGVAGWREIGLPAESPYFNAGVLAIDVERWRRKDVERRSFEYLRRFATRVWFWDQEALNAVLAGDWEPLDNSWNHPPGVPPPAGVRSPRILHFSGNLKPWRVPGKGPLFMDYGRRIDRTAWAGTRPVHSWSNQILAAYAQSPLRAAFLPMERLHMRWTRWSTFRIQQATRHPSP